MRLFQPLMKCLKKKTNLNQPPADFSEIVDEPVIDLITLEQDQLEADELEGWDVTLLDGLEDEEFKWDESQLEIQAEDKTTAAPVDQFVDRSNTGSANYRPREVISVEPVKVPVKPRRTHAPIIKDDGEQNLELVRYKRGPKWQAKNLNNDNTI